MRLTTTTAQQQQQQPQPSLMGGWSPSIYYPRYVIILTVSVCVCVF